LGRVASGLLARQERGAWSTTTANLWASLAVEKFSRKFESTPVTGQTSASLGLAREAFDWSKYKSAPTDTPIDLLPVVQSQSPSRPGPAATPSQRNGVFLPWPKAGEAGGEALSVSHSGTGAPWLTVQSLAAVALKAPLAAGYSITKTVTPVEQAVKGKYSRGDVLRVSLAVNASADMTWVVVSDPIPGGATILGGGLGRDSQIATQGQSAGGGNAWAAFEERSFEAYRSYYDYVPKGSFKLEYTLRLNNVGRFQLPPTRVEAMYAPEIFGAIPNAGMTVEARP
jgi:alpha-2-macroglobulin